ncbi:MAG: MoxR family ATPase [Lentisphaeria bacterium]|nr:MoxR family ATPase [Lentisphaeria bacterium]NQZ70727.1 MoxR family ATPase [Lentisphaeria bacterium]
MNDPKQAQLDRFYEINKQLESALSRVILGKHDVIRKVLAALYSNGSILLEDVPGVGKTTMAKALAKCLGSIFKRIQFTPDLLPADILGGSVYNPQSGEFDFRHGPIFTNILLADEINRASPRTQSALLEAMSERQVTVEGITMKLDEPFLVVATQNPIEFQGTYPLPEAQLDRFLISLKIGYPSPEEELAMLFQQKNNDPLESSAVVCEANELKEIQQHVCDIQLEKSVGKYIIDIVNATRNNQRIRLGASPRASLMILRISQATAFLEQRTFVTPDDVKFCVKDVLSHRLIGESQFTNDDHKDELLQELIDTVIIPT